MSLDRLFDTSGPGVAALWDRLLTLQAELLFDAERRLLEGAAAFRRARTVADLGTGNGQWLARVAAAWPDKRCTGLESSAELVAIARERHAGAPLTFVAADLHELEGTWEALVLRAVLQHVADPRRLARTLAPRVAPGGVLLILENDPKSARTWPPTPRTAALFAALARRQQERRATAPDALAAFLEVLEADPGLAPTADRVAVVTSSAPGALDRFRVHTATTLRLFAETGLFRAEVAAALAEWKAWCSLQTGYAQVGVRLVTVERRG